MKRRHGGGSREGAGSPGSRGRKDPVSFWLLTCHCCRSPGPWAVRACVLGPLEGNQPLTEVSPYHLLFASPEASEVPLLPRRPHQHLNCPYSSVSRYGACPVLPGLKLRTAMLGLHPKEKLQGPCESGGSLSGPPSPPLLLAWSRNAEGCGGHMGPSGHLRMKDGEKIGSLPQVSKREWDL